MPQEVFFGAGQGYPVGCVVNPADRRFPQPFPRVVLVSRRGRGERCEGVGLPEAKPGTSLHDFNHRRDIVRAWMRHGEHRTGAMGGGRCPRRFHSVGPDACQGN